MAKLHYIEFWVISYNKGAGHLSNFFLKTFAKESKTIYAIEFWFAMESKTFYG